MTTIPDGACEITMPIYGRHFGWCDRLKWSGPPWNTIARSRIDEPDYSQCTGSGGVGERMKAIILDGCVYEVYRPSQFGNGATKLITSHCGMEKEVSPQEAIKILNLPSNLAKASMVEVGYAF
jgi:hypothetical protein